MVAIVTFSEGVSSLSSPTPKSVLNTSYKSETFVFNSLKAFSNTAPINSLKEFFSCKTVSPFLLISLKEQSSFSKNVFRLKDSLEPELFFMLIELEKSSSGQVSQVSQDLSLPSYDDLLYYFVNLCTVFQQTVLFALPQKSSEFYVAFLHFMG